MPRLVDKLLTINKFKPNIKKIKHNLKVASVTAITLSIFVSSTWGLNSCSQLQNSTNDNIIENQMQYASDEQIDNLVNDLNCVYDVINHHRTDNNMKHNNGEPIYITFDKNYPEEYKQQTIKSLDYVFGLVNEINDLYYYKIVDDYNSISNKSNIHFASHEPDGIADGWCHYNSNSRKITLATNLKERFPNQVASERYIYNSCLHELLHAFGFDDVYGDGELKNTNNYYGNTVMNVKNDQYLLKLLPNDYKCLIATYAPHTETQQEYENVLNKLQKLSSKYTQEYYALKFSTSSADYTYKSVPIQFSVNFYTNELDAYYNKIGEYEHIIVVNNNSYTIEVYYNGEFVDSCNGNVVYSTYKTDSARVAILENIKLSNTSIKNKFMDECEILFTDISIKLQDDNQYEIAVYGKGWQSYIYKSHKLEMNNDLSK